MQRGKPLKSDPEKYRAMQDRARDKAIAKLREKGAKLAPKEAGSGAVARSGTFTAPAARSGSASKGRVPGGGSAGSTTTSRSRKKPPNDGPWRAACLMARGEQCRSCLTTGWIQMDHVKPKSQGGLSVVENGLPLCQECHRKKTDSEILIEWAWLDPDQLVYLASIGWVDWNDDGEPFGRGLKHFARKTSARERKVDTHGKDSSG